MTAPAAQAAVVPTTTVLSDNFNRSVKSGFGDADAGGGYTYGDVRNLSDDGSRGQIALTASVARNAVLKSDSRADSDAVNSFGVSALPTAGSVYLSQMLRTDSSGAYLGPRLRIMPDKSIQAGFRYNAANGSSTLIGKDVTLPFTMTSANMRLMVHSQVQGNDLRMKVWPQGQAEPSDWTVTASSSLQSDPGYFGVWAYLGGGTNAITVNVDDITVKALEEPNVAPNAAFTSSVNDLAVSLDGSGSNDPDGSVASYAWDFGDGTSGTGKTVTKNYSKAGTYNVSLTVTDNRGATASVSKSVTAIAPNILPTAAFSSSVSDLDAAFDASGSVDPDGSISAYSWDFGDGTTASGRTVSKHYITAGTYNVKLTVVDNRNGAASVSKSVVAIAPNILPTAAFSSSVNDLDVAFDGSASVDPDGTISAYAWDFGDGTTGTGKTVSKHYNTAGNYKVTLTVTDNRGGKANLTQSVTAIAPNILPTAAFQAGITDLSATMDASGSFDADGTIVAYNWDFGDGTTGTGATASKVYATPGNYTVTLTVTDNRGGKNTTTRSLTAIAPNVPPVAGFTSTVNDQDVAFDGSQSFDPDGTVVSYAWDFGDGTTGTGKTVSKHYNAPGNYTVTLKVTDNRNGTATQTSKITAIAPNVLPTAAFTSNATDLAASFDASGSFDPDGTVTAYAWNFGDGTTATGKTANKQYSAGGTYTVTLTVTDNRGGTATATKQVTVIPPNVLPNASFTATQKDLTTSVDASGSNDPDGSIVSYAWNFGDGSTATGATASNAYSTAGTYTVTLTVTDNRGGTATTTRSVTATNPAPVRPSASNTGVPDGTPLKVYNGDLTITTPGTVIDSMDIRGFVVVKAANVTIKRSIIRGGTTAPTASKGLLSIVQAGATGYLIEDVTLLPQISSPNIDAVKVNQAGTFNRINSSGTVDGLVIYGDGVTVQNSYIHDEAHFLVDPNQGGGPSHDDNIQVQAGRNIAIVNNTLQGAYNAAVMITQDAGVTQNLSINNNWIDGGGCSLNYKTNGAYKTGMQANNNRFGRNQRVSGCAIIHNAAASDLNPQGNVWDDNGTPAGIKKGA